MRRICVLLLVLLLSGCNNLYSVPSLVVELDTDLSIREGVYTSPLVSPALSTVSRKPSIMNSDILGIDVTDESLYWNWFIEKPTYWMNNIYRKLLPIDEEVNVFSQLKSTLDVYDGGFDQRTALGDVFVPYLLTNEAIAASDDSIAEQLNNVGIDAHVESSTLDSTSIRFIAVRLPTSGDDHFFHACAYNYVFIQMWDNEHVWAQPLFEAAELDFDGGTANQSVLFMLDGDGHFVMIMAGHRNAYAPFNRVTDLFFSGWIFEDDKWRLMSDNELSIEVFDENMGVGTHVDGIVVIPTYIHVSEDVSHGLQYYFWEMYDSEIRIKSFNSVDVAAAIISLN